MAVCILFLRINETTKPDLLQHVDKEHAREKYGVYYFI